MTSEKKREPGFEQDLERLERIVSALEEGGLSLEEALKQFESGIRLTRKCEKALRDAERKIELLTRSMDGEIEAKPFDEDTAEASIAPARSPVSKTSDNEDAPYPDEPPEPPYVDDDEDLDGLF